MFKKILVAIDESEMSQQVFYAALALAKAANGHLMLLHILTSQEEKAPVPPIMTSLAYYPTFDDRLLEIYQEEWQSYADRGLELLQSLTQEATAAQVTAEFTQKTGTAAAAICEFARQWKADLIVIGRRGRAGLQEWVLGSVSNYVTHHAPCSVLTVQGYCPTELPEKTLCATNQNQS